MCLDSGEHASNEESDFEMETSENCPSVGLSRIKQLSREGGAHEVFKPMKKSVSTPDFKYYFTSF